MKKIKYPLFSNGTEFTMWDENNCTRCVKAARIVGDEIKGHVTKCRCAIQREIADAYLSDEPVSQRTYDIVQSGNCPHIQLHWKQYPRKPKFDNQPKLFEV